MSKLLIKRLHPNIIIKGHVQNCEESNYELFMNELVNNSEFFRKKGGGEYILLPQKEQNSGQDDCLSEKYSIDFKLFGSKSALKAQSTLTMQWVQYIKGVYAECEPKEKNSLKTVSLYVVLKQLSCSDLINIENDKFDYNGQFDKVIRKDIKTYLGNISKNKNLLLLFEYQFFYDERPGDEQAIAEITEAVKSIFVSSIMYREKKTKEKDFYVAIVYYEWFFIYELSKNVSLVDKVLVDKCSTYTFLSKIR